MEIETLYVYDGKKLIATKTVPADLTAGDLLDHIKMLRGIYGKNINVRTTTLEMA